LTIPTVIEEEEEEEEGCIRGVRGI